MESITSIKSVTNWLGNTLIKSTYEHTEYAKGNPVTKVTHHAIAEIYNKKGKLEQQPNQGNNIDKQI